MIMIAIIMEEGIMVVISLDMMVEILVVALMVIIVIFLLIVVIKIKLTSGRGRLWGPALGVVKTLHTDNKQHKENMKT